MGLSIQRSDAFGYHTYDQLEGKVFSAINKLAEETGKPMPSDVQNKMKEILPMANLGKNLVTIAGYIPVIGTIVAIAKLIMIRKAERSLEEAGKKAPSILTVKKEIQEYFTGQKIRSWMELTSLGCLLLIPDLIFTIGRNISNKPVENVA